MSDTRFLEGGKYYYNEKNENDYPNGYESSATETTNVALEPKVQE